MAKKLAEQIHESLRTEIVHNRIKPGQVLDEDAIAAEYNVSRTPVREALLALQKESLIKIVPRYGTYVSEIDPLFVSKTLRVKARLEGLAAELAAPNITKQDLEMLRDLISPDIFLDAEQLNEVIGEQDAKFHALIRQRCNNEVLVRAIEELEYTVLHFWHYIVPTHPEFVHAIDYLAQTIDAYAQHDAIQAGYYMEQHALIFYPLIQKLIQ